MGHSILAAVPDSAPSSHLLYATTAADQYRIEQTSPPPSLPVSKQDVVFDQASNKTRFEIDPTSGQAAGYPHHDLAEYGAANKWAASANPSVDVWSPKQTLICLTMQGLCVWDQM